MSTRSTALSINLSLTYRDGEWFVTKPDGSYYSLTKNFSNLPSILHNIVEKESLAVMENLGITKVD